MYLEKYLCKFYLFRAICNSFSVLQELGLKKQFLENDDSRHTMKNLAALAFIPERNVIEEFNQIKENTPEVLDGR